MKKKRSDERSVITRRHFLEHLGLVGGASVVMGAMSSWDLMGYQGATRPVLTGRPAGTKVIVLGGGVSGLTTCYELNKLGYDVQILEARERVGGVNWTIRRGTEHTELGTGGEHQVCQFDEGMYVNAGPWRIPHTHTGVLDYCKELGVPLQIFINEAEASYIYSEGKDAGAMAGKRVRLREVKADLLGYSSELLAKCVDQDRLDMPLSAEDKERLLTFLVTEGYLDSTDHVYKGSTARPGDPYDFKQLLASGFGSRVRSVLGGTGQAPMFQPIGGIDQFPKGFQRALGSKIMLGAEVQSVHQTPEGVTIAYMETANGKKHEVKADFCVSCLPLSIVSGLDINLSPEMMTAVKATTYSPIGKMGLQMKRRFWEEDDRIFGGHLYSDLPLGEFSYPSNDFFGKKGVLLGFYGNGRMNDLVNQPVKARLEHVITQAGKVHPQMRAEYETGYAVFWEKIKYSLGAYAAGAGRGGGRGGAGGRSNGAARLEQLGKPDDRLFIGCAAANEDPAWMQGAVESGWHAVRNLHERAMRK